jgi:hypothetical protein
MKVSSVSISAAQMALWLGGRIIWSVYQFSWGKYSFGGQFHATV